MNHDDAMKAAQERNLEMSLEERLGGRTPPDLSARILDAAKAGDVDGAPVHDLSVAREKRANPWAIAAAAACVVLGLGLIVADRWIGGSDKPGASLVHQDAAEDIVFLQDTAEPIDIGDGYIEGVAGRALVSTSGVPSPERLASMTEMFKTRHAMNTKEIAMMKNRNNWVTRGSLAMCVLSGGLLFSDNEAYFAEEDEAAKRLSEDGAAKEPPQVQRAGFDDLDADKDGYLDPAEYPAINPEDDADKDGRYSKAEYDDHMDAAVKASKDALEAAVQQFEEAMRAQGEGVSTPGFFGPSIDPKEYDSAYFDELDVNHDGELDGNEYRIPWLLSHDRNNDGMVSRAELDATRMPANPFALPVPRAQAPDPGRVDELKGKLQKMRAAAAPPASRAASSRRR